MGTSTSSKGPGAGVPLDPPWLDELMPEVTGPTDADAQAGVAPDGNGQPADDGNQAFDAAQSAVAPSGRFRSARRDLGKFIRTGDHQALSRSIGHYSRTGMGGAPSAASRMRVATSAGAGLFSFAQALRDGTNARVSQWVQDLLATNPSSQDVVDAIVRELASPGGSADEESLRDSMALALNELLTLQADMDLLQMSDSDTWTLLQLFLGHEVCNRLEFDVGQFFESAKLDPALGVQREMEMRVFVRNEVGVQLDALRTTTPNPTRAQLETLVRDAVRMTFEVYEGEL